MKSRIRHRPLAPPRQEKNPSSPLPLLRLFHTTTTAPPRSHRLEIGLQPNGPSLKVSNGIKPGGLLKPLSHISELSNSILLITTPNTISHWQLRMVAIL